MKQINSRNPFNSGKIFLSVSFLLAILLPAIRAEQRLLGTILSGTNENPSNASPGTGPVSVRLDTTAHTLTISATFSGLTGSTTAAHIHCCVVPPGNIGVATTLPNFIGFPLGVTSGSFSTTLGLTASSSYSSSFVSANGGTLAGAEAALTAGLLAGRAYFNVHTNLFAGGEIRGFLKEHRRYLPVTQK